MIAMPEDRPAAVRGISGKQVLVFSQRWLLRPAGGATALAGLTGCSPRLLATQTSATREIVQLVFHNWRTQWLPSMARQVLAAFPAAHPTIRVFYVTDPDNLEENWQIFFGSEEPCCQE